MALERPKKLGPVSDQERAEYWPRLGSDRRRGCPTQKTAEAVWGLLAEAGLPVQIDDLLPRRKKPSPPEEHARAIVVAKQSVLVAIDCAIDAGDRGKMLTVVRLLDALAGRWSLAFRQARRRSGARTVRDMWEETTRAVWRELLVAGVRFDTLKRIATGPWSRSPGPNPLYSVTRVSGSGHPLSWRVNVKPSESLRTFEALVRDDGQYRRLPGQHLVIFDEDWRPAPRRVRQDICAERPCDVVQLGAGGERVLALLEEARSIFNVEVFREDYETVRDYLEAAPRPCTRVQRRGYEKIRAFVAGYRRVYRDTGGGPADPRLIRSRFFRSKN